MKLRLQNRLRISSFTEPALRTVFALFLGLTLLASCRPETKNDRVFRNLPFDVDVGDSGPALVVNGVEVEPEMLQLIAVARQPEVLAFFRERFGTEGVEDFWSHSFDGKIPEDRLRRLTLIETVQFKLIELVAVKYGLRDSADFEDVKKRWKEENERRATVIEAGEDLYGPAQYSLFEFFQQDMQSLSLAVRQTLEREEVLRAIEDESWIPAGQESRVERLRRTYNTYLERQMNQAIVKVNRMRFLEIELVAPPDSLLQAGRRSGAFGEFGRTLQPTNEL